MKSVYPELNFPDFEPTRKVKDDIEHIWDPIRKKWIVLTAEEWVRQHLIHYLVESLQYPKGLIQVECQIPVGKLKKRFDLVVMDKQLNPWLICECKAPAIPIDPSVLQQASMYNSKLKCPYLAVTNGLAHYCFHIEFNTGTFKKMSNFPSYEN